MMKIKQDSIGITLLQNPNRPQHHIKLNTLDYKVIQQPSFLLDHKITSFRELPKYLGDKIDIFAMDRHTLKNLFIHFSIIQGWLYLRDHEFFCVWFDDVYFFNSEKTLNQCLALLKKGYKLVGLSPTNWEKQSEFNYLTWRFYVCRHHDFVPYEYKYLMEKYGYPHPYITQLAECFEPAEVKFLNVKWKHKHSI